MIVILTLNIDIRFGGEEIIQFFGNPAKSLSTAFECLINVKNLGSIEKYGALTSFLGLVLSASVILLIATICSILLILKTITRKKSCEIIKAGCICFFLTV